MSALQASLWLEVLYFYYRMYMTIELNLNKADLCVAVNYTKN